jgi:hypothetical protein
MALPKINENLQFSTKIPSTGEKIKYRPYLVKEEKVLLQAFESQNLKIILEAMCQTIDACLDTKSKIRGTLYLRRGISIHSTSCRISR